MWQTVNNIVYYTPEYMPRNIIMQSLAIKNKALIYDSKIAIKDYILFLKKENKIK